MNLIQIQFGLTLITCHHPPKNLIPAFGADIPGFFIFNPFFRPHLSPIGNGPQDDLFPHGHRKMFNMGTGEIGALVAAAVAFFFGAGPDLTLATMKKEIIRQATLTADILRGKLLAVGKGALAGHVSLVKPHQPLLEFLIVVPVGHIDGADPAIESARGHKIRIDGHNTSWMVYR